MKLSEIKQQVINSYHAKTPYMIWGQPGVGKSDLIRQVAKELGISLKDERLSQMDPVDMRGIPFRNEQGMTQWAIPGFLPQEERDGQYGILFLDEINTAPQSVSAAAYQLILDRQLGDYKLPDGWMVIAAGNRAKDRAIAIRMSAALSNRFGHGEVEVDINEWMDWAMANKIHTDIIGFLRYKTGLLNDYDPDKTSFPTPRSWEFLNRHMPYMDDQNRYNTLKSFVGEGAAAEFIAYHNNKADLPQFDEIIQNPKGTKLPKEASAMFALSSMISPKITLDNFSTVLDYLGRIQPDYQVITIQDAIKYTPELSSTQEFINWSVTNNHVIL